MDIFARLLVVVFILNAMAMCTKHLCIAPSSAHAFIITENCNKKIEEIENPSVWFVQYAITEACFETGVEYHAQVGTSFPIVNHDDGCGRY